MKSLSLSKPHLLIMIGVPGSGKTFFAEKFAEMFRAPFVSYEKISTLIDSDKQIEALANYQLDELFKTQQSIILEGTGATRVERTVLAKKAKTAGYETLLIWAQIDPASAKARSTGNKARPLSSEEYDRQAKRFTAPNASEKYVVISGKHTYASQAKVVLMKLSGPRTEISTHAVAPVRTDQPARHNITIR